MLLPILDVLPTAKLLCHQRKDPDYDRRSMQRLSCDVNRPRALDRPAINDE